MIDTVVFDLGNVLIGFDWEDAYRNILGFEGEKFERIANATTRHEDWNLHDKGDFTEEEMLNRFISNDPEDEADIRRMYEDLSILVNPYDYADAWIDGLHEAGYKVYILSNYSEKSFKQASEKLAFVKRADGAVISYQEKLIKPDPAFYQVLFDRYGVIPENAVFIDDREDNIQAAIGCGMNGIVYRTKAQVLKELSDLGVQFEEKL